MRNLGKWVAAAACAALLALAAAPALGADVVVVAADRQIRIGGLVLDPGMYLLRSDYSTGSLNVLLVTSVDQRKVFGAVLANYESSWKLEEPADRLIFDQSDGRTLRTWIVAWRGVGYHFSAAPVSPAMAARVRSR